MKKLELVNLKVKKITEKEKKDVKGGFLSIGHVCSHRNSCDRLETKCEGECYPRRPEDYDILSVIYH
jgi:hypothetical protein